MKPLKKVLVVDDDPVVGMSFNRVLDGKGYAVITASSGAEALERLAAEDYDVVYTDIKMPGMDGIEVARRIKASRPWLPVLIVTGYGNDENEAAARKIGVSAFLRKPLTPEAIEDSALGAVTAPPAPEPEKPVAALEKPLTGGRKAALFARNVGLFFAAPFITLFYVVFGPVLMLGILAWTGVKALRHAPKAE